MKMLRLLCGLLLSCSSLMVLACEHPSLPVIPPEGDIEPQTRRVQRDTQRYVKAMVDYVACIQAELEAANSDGARPMRLALLARRNNAAVAEVNTVTGIFAERVGPLEDIGLSSLSAPPASTENTIPAAAQRPGREEVAEDDIEFDREPQSCVSMSRIDRTEIVDDQTILFFQRGGRVYMNLLETNCPTLRSNGVFRYRISSGALTARLCDFHAITVMDRLSDSPTYNCKLGMFHPLLEDEAEQMLSPMTPSPVRMEPVEAQPEEDPAPEATANKPPDGVAPHTVMGPRWPYSAL